MRRVAPWIARGLRTAALAAAADHVESSSDAPGAGAIPGVVVVDARNRVTQRTPAAAGQLADLSDDGAPSDQLPTCLAGLLARQRRGAGDSAELRVPGRSGRWYSVRATLTEPDEHGRTSSVLIVAPMTRADVAPMLARLWGLTPREREVIALVARGYATKEIAGRMGISAYTVQDHLDHASEKVGVRGRRELLAKLFFGGYVTQLAR
jgi:DNA-binding CsgD family transcriptional regulator